MPCRRLVHSSLPLIPGRASRSGRISSTRTGSRGAGTNFLPKRAYSPCSDTYALNICVQVANVKEQGSFVNSLTVGNPLFHDQSAQRFHAAVKVCRSLSNVQQARLNDVFVFRFQLSRLPHDSLAPLPCAGASSPRCCQPAECGAETGLHFIKPAIYTGIRPQQTGSHPVLPR